MCNTEFAQNNEIITYTQSSNSITVYFTLPAYQLVDTNTYALYGINQFYKYIKIDNFGIVDDIGFPELPQYSIDFAIPENASNITVTLSILEFNHQLSEPLSIFNQKGITFSIFPFTYNPSINKLTVLKSGTFTITYSTFKYTTVNDYTSNSREDYLSQLFCNYPRTKSGAIHIGRYLIITPQTFENTLTYFANSLLSH